MELSPNPDLQVTVSIPNGTLSDALLLTGPMDPGQKVVH
jgi:hypothetical protein